VAEEQAEGYNHVADFYDAVKSDLRINVYHISLYLTLVQMRNLSGWQNPITIYRGQVMRLGRMSRRTFNKCMKDLTQFGYLKYEASTDPAEGSKVYFKKL